MPLNPRITDWKGQVCWLVGASTGIGRATAEQLHAAGATVIVSARNVAALQEFAQSHARGEALPMDATDREAVHTAARKVIDTHGRIDLVMYCAGHYKAQRATAYDLDEMLKHQQINVTGAYIVLGAVLPQLRRLLGRGLPNALAYGPTKAALINLGETMYLDLQPKGIGVSVINPGFVETPLTAGNKFDMPALITPAQAAQQIIKGWAAGDFEIHFPKRFTLWLKALQHLTDGLYFAAIRRSTGL
jgi:NAD(P)-dependent dehydrogenase (short-subunit alcohol dehydrogenase family)